MTSALLVRFRPAGPWRLGPENGARTHVGTVLHSDTLYSAITLAMRDCGWLDEWIAATAQSDSPAVRIGSGYPFTGSTLLVVPPRTVWPPAQGGKLRWKTAKFVPLTLVPRLLAGEVLSQDDWAVDPASECLLPVFRKSIASAPFRIVRRTLAPVDRVTGATEATDSVACLQFAQGAGIWFLASFADESARSVWAGRMRSVARLLADTGIGGGRSRGWGRSREPQFGNVELPEFLTGAVEPSGETAWWTLSLFSPAESDQVDWDRGSYGMTVRAGRVESEVRHGDLKPAARLIAEGSVLLSGTPLSGTTRNVAPAEFPHPVYRSGIALAVAVPYREAQKWELVDHAAPALATEVVEESTPVEGPAPVEEPVIAEPESVGSVEEPALIEESAPAVAVEMPAAVEDAEPVEAGEVPSPIESVETPPPAGEAESAESSEVPVYVEPPDAPASDEEPAVAEAEDAPAVIEEPEPIESAAAPAAVEEVELAEAAEVPAVIEAAESAEGEEAAAPAEPVEEAEPVEAAEVPTSVEEAVIEGAEPLESAPAPVEPEETPVPEEPGPPLAEPSATEPSAEAAGDQEERS